MKILIVDSEPTTRAYLEDFLRYFGCEVERNGTLKMAIKRLQKERYDGMVVDLYVDDGCTVRLLEWLKEEARDEPVVMMSEEADYSLLTQLVRAGAADLVSKMFQPMSLQRVMRLAFVDRATSETNRRSATRSATPNAT